MKRIIVFLLALCLCVGLCACGEDVPAVGPGPIPVNQSNQPNEPAPFQEAAGPIDLTTGNWSEYLDIDVDLEIGRAHV